MAELIYVTNMTLDGFIEDERGEFAFLPVDDEVLRSHTETLRSAGTFLYGRRLYETMAVWETDPALAEQSALTADFAAVWRQADKVVYSTTLAGATTDRTRLERTFDPAAVRALKDTSERALTVGGADLAAQALEAGLVDECHVYVLPLLLGAGRSAFGARGRADLDLVGERRFANGVMLLRYRPRNE